MAKDRPVFHCRACNATHPRWLGRCPDCGVWDALEEGTAGAAPPVRAVRLADVEAVPDVERLGTGLRELDRVLGGGLVPGSVVLIGGEPGIGKSTLLLQAGGSVSSTTPALYVTSEESLGQVRTRAKRLGVESEGLFVLADTNLKRVVEQVRTTKARIVVVDSIQMLYDPGLDASPGSVSQLRHCAGELVTLAKTNDICMIVIGHVTKEGTLAGPRLLEHLVDAVLYFEGDRHHAHRVVRAIKNRFGATHELGVFEMTSGGLRDVEDPAGICGTGAEARPGSVVAPVMSGTRCLLVEIQALTATGFLGSAKRRATGVDANRLAMLIAVLEQHVEMRLADRDIFASVVGGIRVSDPGSDLALLLAVAGAHLRRSLEPRTCAIGEVGLGGEIRPVSNMEQRLREASRLGMSTILAPSPHGTVECGSVTEAIRFLGA